MENIQISSTLFTSLLSFVPPGTKINVTVGELIALRSVDGFVAIDGTETEPVGRIGEIYFYRR